jgi:hypothetical protein
MYTVAISKLVKIYTDSKVQQLNSLFTQPPHEGQPSRSAHATSASAPPFQSGGGLGSIGDAGNPDQA